MTAVDDEPRGRDDGPYSYGVVDRGLLARALTALVAHHAKRRANDETRDLFGDDADVNVQFGLREVPRRPGPKPVRLSLPRPLHRVDDDDDDDDDDYLDRASVCLIVKSDETKAWVRELLENENVAPYHSVKKVLTLDSLRKKHTSHAQRRELCSRFDLFLADDRVLPMLGKALGRTFFDRKKNPVPIRLTRREALPHAVRECLEGTFLYVPRGRCANVRIGNTRAPIDHLVDNVVAVVEGAVDRLSGWRNLSSLSIKTCDSASLPFYLMTPDRATTIQRAKQIADKRPRDKTTTKDDDKDDDAEKTKKRKTDKSSPLLRALRKAEDVDSTNTKKHEDDDNNEKTKKKKKRSSELPADQTTETKKTKTRKDVNEALDEKKEKTPAKSDETKKRRDHTSTPTKEDDEKKKEEEASGETLSASDKKKKKKKKKDGKQKKHDEDGDEDDAEKKKKKSEAKKKNEIVETKTEESTPAKHSSEKKKKKKKKKDDDHAESRTTTTTDGEKEEESPPSFAPSKTFRGSRAGRVFRTGDRGVGYYADEVPVSDPTLSRTRGRQPQQQKRRRSGGGKGRSRSGSRR